MPKSWIALILLEKNWGGDQLKLYQFYCRYGEKLSMKMKRVVGTMSEKDNEEVDDFFVGLN